MEDGLGFERVGARYVVIVGVLAAPDHAASLVFLARNGLELHLNEAIFELRVVLDADGKRRLARLLQHIRLARCILGLFYSPLCCPSSRLCSHPVRRKSARFFV